MTVPHTLTVFQLLLLNPFDLPSPPTLIINNCIKMRCFPRLQKYDQYQKCHFPLLILITVLFRCSLYYQKSGSALGFIFNPTQSGYCAGDSCVTILHKLNNDIQTSLNKGEVTFPVMTFAFDIITHSALVKKFKFSNTLHEKCPYSELFWSAFSRTRNEYECGKVRTRITITQ